jgi:phosphate/sulfate permease
LFRAVLLRLGTGVAIVGALRAGRSVILPLWAVSLGLPESTTALIIGLGGAMDFALFYASGQVMDRFGRLWSVVPSLLGMGAGMIVLVTNDSWFSESDETVQHVWQATPRASETALPIIRVGNSGVTGVYYPDGSSWWLGGDKKGEYLLDKPGCGYARVAIPRQSAKILTPYVKYGDKPLLILFMLVLLFAINHRFLNIWYNLRQ